MTLENVITPGGGQSDTWHGLNCKGKYAGEIRIELTFYDTRPKMEKTPVEKKRESTRPDSQSPAIGGPRENTPVKRRPLPSDPTGASPSPVNTPEHRGLQGAQAGPRGYPTPPRQQRSSEHTPTHQRRSYHPDTPQRRPLPDASPSTDTQTPRHQHAPRPAEQDLYHTPPNPRSSNTNLSQHDENGFDMSYTAPKPYEVQPVDPQHPRDFENRTMSQNDSRSSRGFSHPQPIDLPHSHSAPVVPTHNSYDPEPVPQDPYSDTAGYPNGHMSQPDGYAQDTYQDPAYQVEPLRLSRNSRSPAQVSPAGLYQATSSYGDPQNPYTSHGRRASSMQPTVEDEDDIPPPPPVHRSDAHTLVQHHQPPPPDYRGDELAPLNTQRYREESSGFGYDSPPESYGLNDYGNPYVQERRYTHPAPSSRPVSRDVMVPSPLRNETSVIPSSLVAGYSSSRQNRDSAAYQSPPSYEPPPCLRQYSEPDYRTPSQYDTPTRPHPLAHHQSAPPPDASPYYPHDPPEQPRRRSPAQDPAPIVKPRAISPGASPVPLHSPADSRQPRMAARGMPTRKSVSPRPPSFVEPERRLSGVPFNPDSFDVFNPALSKANSNGAPDPERPSSSMEVNEKGQIVTFNGRVVDASDHLPVDSWAPEPEPKGDKKERTTRSRPALSGARDLEAAKQREERYRRERAERERIRNAANATFGSSSNALVTSRHNFSNNNSPANSGAMVLADRDGTPPSAGRNRLQKRNGRPMSTYDSPTHSPPVTVPMPNTNVLRECENLGGYGSSLGYSSAGARHPVAAPPIPAKIPLERGDEDMTALSLELQSIDIGPGSGGRRGRGTARRYGF